MSMTESENKLFDNLMQHNSAYYGYELCKGEIKTILQSFEELKQYRAIGTVSEFRELKEKATAVCIWEDDSRHVVCGHGQVEYRYKVRDWSFCPYCGMRVNVGDWSEGKE